MSGIKKKILEAFLTLFFLGKIPFAPGTFGSLFGLFLGFLFFFFHFHFSFFLFIAFGLTRTAIPLIDVYEKETKKHDQKSIIVDELIGIFFAFFLVGFCEINAINLILAFILFRFFDIGKPWIIKKADKNIGWWWWVIFDDILAWIFAWVMSLILIFTFNIFPRDIFWGLMIIASISLFVIYGTHFIISNKKKREKIQKLFLLHPNTISFLRIPIWIFAILFFHYDYSLLAIFLFTIAVVSDYSDGVIARACNLKTELGKSLDPLADKIVYFLPLLYFWYIWKINILLVLIFIFIDSVGQFSRIFLKKMQKETKANSFGKVKTTLVFIFLFYFFLLERFFIIPSIISSIFLILFSLLAVFSLVRKVI